MYIQPLLIQDLAKTGAQAVDLDTKDAADLRFDEVFANFFDAARELDEEEVSDAAVAEAASTEEEVPENTGKADGVIEIGELRGEGEKSKEPPPETVQAGESVDVPLRDARGVLSGGAAVVEPSSVSALEAGQLRRDVSGQMNVGPRVQEQGMQNVEHVARLVLSEGSAHMLADAQARDAVSSLSHRDHFNGEKGAEQVARAVPKSGLIGSEPAQSGQFDAALKPPHMLSEAQSMRGRSLFGPLRDDGILSRADGDRQQIQRIFNELAQGISGRTQGGGSGEAFSGQQASQGVTPAFTSQQAMTRDTEGKAEVPPDLVSIQTGEDEQIYSGGATQPSLKAIGEVQEARAARAYAALAKGTVLNAGPPELAVEMENLIAADDVELIALKESGPMQIRQAADVMQAHGLTAAKANAAVNSAVGEMIRNGRHDIELQLSPEELGRVRFRMVSVEGHIVVHVTADRPETLEAMRRHADVFSQNLNKAGYESASFEFNQQGQGNAERHFGSQRGMVKSAASEADTRSVERRQAISSDRIDIRV